VALVRNLPAEAAVFDVFSAYPDLFAPIAEFSQKAFRGPGPLPPRDRELIFAYASQLNACAYCFGGHASTSKLLGAADDVFEKLKADIGTAPVDPKLRPLLRTTLGRSLVTSKRQWRSRHPWHAWAIVTVGTFSSI